MKPPVGYEITMPVPLELLVEQGLADVVDELTATLKPTYAYRTFPLMAGGIPLGQFSITSVEVVVARRVGGPDYIVTATCVGDVPQ